MREEFIDHKFTPEKMQKLALIGGIIEGYLAQGLRLTLRQLYYQLVVRNAIKNEEKEYKRLSELLSNGRLAGLIDWDAIEDRLRKPSKPSDWETIQSLAESAAHQFRLPRWRGQENYVELWVEKDALAGVLWPIAREYHVTLMVNRGYSSQSAMYESAKRFEDGTEGGQQPTILYLGDHDPSGEDMVRDVQERLSTFGVDVNVEKIALTKLQVETFRPPPNPAKMTDSRAGKYVALHGAVCWEVDALPPEELARIIKRELNGLVDKQMMEEVVDEEEELKKKFLAAVGKIK